MLKISSLETFWGDFWAWAWKSLKLVSWKASGVILGLGLEILKNSFLEAFWSDFWGWAWKSLKIVSWKASGATFAAGLGNARK